MQTIATMPQLGKLAPDGSAAGARRLVQGARCAAALLFLADGMVFGTWAALIPSFQQKFQLSHAKLGVLLLALIAGAMVSMPLTGKLTGRWGSQRIAGPAAVGFSAMLLLLAFAPGYLTLMLAAWLFGFWKGALDISINSQAITLEQAIGRPINGSFQGWWSVGGLGAAALLTLLMHQGYPPRALMVAMAILMLAPAIWSFGRLLADSAPPKPAARMESPKRPKLLWLLGGVAFLALFGEGSMFDWAAVYVHSVAGIPVAQAPIGFGAFIICMATARFLGDWVTLKAGPANTLRISGLLMAVGISVAVVTHHWLAILMGFALVGLGTANMVPVLYTATGRLPGAGTGANLAMVATMGYLGFLSGPPLIGFVAEAAGLPLALSLVIVTGAIIATLGAAIVRKAANTGNVKSSNLG